ncbi:type II secretion system F family protein [Nocardioides marmoribigeumensis]|uniref:Tight adherence protein B n=1 Tax=Nocardioides marmoribigeumensis TaxID=433649 RepID=A0ABU2BPH9_9ACTN|nr:type II secretion system F family protein [Nocardioides marmoribigeumensis]MDR7360547.1 tight adherence protein B [Nocardioides marmoribigeumensis]
MSRRATRTALRSVLAAGAAGALLLLAGAPALAATSSIDYIEPKDGGLRVVVSLDDVPAGTTPDLATVTATLDGDPVTASAESLSKAADKVERTTVLALDVSDSMARGGRFDQAKAAAKAFLANVPDDVNVGLVTFADTVKVVAEPTTDTATLDDAIDGLTLSRGTSLYDGVIQAVKTAGSKGSRSVLLLSDGNNTNKTPLGAATAAAKKSKVVVDVVALAQGAGTPFLEEIASAGGGRQIAADDPAALQGLFEDQANALASQVLVTIKGDKALAGKEGTLAVTLQVDGSPVTDDAFVSFPKPEVKPGGGEAASKIVPADTGFLIPAEAMYAGLAAAAVAFAFIVLLASGAVGANKQQDAVDRSIEAYTRKGAKKLAAAAKEPENQSVTQQAVAGVEKALEGQKGLESALGDRLEAAGMSLKPAEWLLMHMGVAVLLALIGLLMTGGNAIFMLLGLFFGIAGPWFYLSFARRRRLKKFKSQLADTLQLMSGALSAGLSLAQGVDTVVREGSDPVAGEFRRALMETRLGVEIEDALMGVADRMQSVDFEWVVMAIRIQREVGGNLAELLNKVAETIREREYLERQVLTLSAEGRLSVWILGGLPPGFMAYLALANPRYLKPMYTNPLGWAMLVVMSVLLTAGIFWMRKLVKVEV